MLLLPALGAWGAHGVRLAIELSGCGGLEWPMGLGWPMQVSGHGVGVAMGVEWPKMSGWPVGLLRWPMRLSGHGVEVAMGVGWP